MVLIVLTTYSRSFKNENTKYFFNLKAGYYHHEFDQDIIADNISRKDFRSDRHKFFVRPSLGFSFEKNIVTVSQLYPY